jgi:hypothetical protein
VHSDDVDGVFRIYAIKATPLVIIVTDWQSAAQADNQASCNANEVRNASEQIVVNATRAFEAGG